MKTTEESRKANAFFDRIYDETVDRHPETQSYLGIKKDYGEWSDRSDEHAQKELEILKGHLKTLKETINREQLDDQTRISYDLFLRDAQERIDHFSFRFHNLPVNQMGGFHSEIPAFLINIHRIDDEKDARAYLSRLKKVDALFEQQMVQLKIREEKGILPPRFVFPQVLEDCRNILTGRPFREGDENLKASPLLEDFSGKVGLLKKGELIDSPTELALLNEAEEILKNTVGPSYRKLMHYLQNLERKAPREGGAHQYPQGNEFYRVALQEVTTTTLGPEEIHQIGQREVKRIQNEIRVLMKKVEFKGDMESFFEFMRKDPRFYLPNTPEGREDYMKRNNLIIEAMKKRLPELFFTLPKAPLAVKAVEPFREKSAGGAFYQDASLDGGRPGTYYINLYNMNDQPLYQLEALAYHEAIPGHHMQISIAQELQNLPKFRKFGGHTAYIEGWGLYSEYIPKELGFYQDPYSDIGRLSMELYRAARLVLDTGIHFKKWTKDQATTYMLQNTLNAEEDCRKEVERYIVWPGQATGYKIGMLKILELREYMKERLGNDFDLREFHEVILTNGSLPLDVLEGLIKGTLDKKLSQK